MFTKIKWTFFLYFFSEGEKLYFFINKICNDNFPESVNLTYSISRNSKWYKKCWRILLCLKLLVNRVCSNYNAVFRYSKMDVHCEMKYSCFFLQTPELVLISQKRVRNVQRIKVNASVVESPSFSTEWWFTYKINSYPFTSINILSTVYLNLL